MARRIVISHDVRFPDSVAIWCWSQLCPKLGALRKQSCAERTLARDYLPRARETAILRGGVAIGHSPCWREDEQVKTIVCGFRVAEPWLLFPLTPLLVLGGRWVHDGRNDHIVQVRAGSLIHGWPELHTCTG
ncbi:hypothetical protein N7468_010236 [Penicillium chermesinum]|uniref:Uncharacterized protein n=1 Tax=Penicillium chermesinum TaxID=63820 RepID=A0A9W9NCD2_9EURO|nr:uncharacterized protein N7468_010236 [Penicillium chermesinum]KAJ5217228.1 hypothetical protein N7468_010236 [Penicillium chermesinum]